MADKSLDIPANILLGLPSPSLSVNDALCWSHPCMGNLLPLTLAKSWYLTAESNAKWISIQDISLPPASFIHKLANGLSDAKKRGCLSLNVPNNTLNSMLVPLWVVPYWVSVVEDINAKSRWMDVMEWLTRVDTRTGGKADLPRIQRARTKARKLLGCLAWKGNIEMRLSAYTFPAWELSELLSDRWIGDGVICRSHWN